MQVLKMIKNRKEFLEKFKIKQKLFKCFEIKRIKVLELGNYNFITVCKIFNIPIKKLL